MKGSMFFCGGPDLRSGFAACLLAMGMMVGSAGAQVYNLTSGNATASINAGGGSGPLGLNSWVVDGISQAKQQWYYYGIGAAANQSVDSMGNLTLNSQTASSVQFTYANAASSPDYKVTLYYNLTAAANGSGISGMGETATFYNLSANPLTLRFFDYTDMDLTGTPNNQSVTLYNKSLGTTYFYQTAGSYTFTNKTVSSAGGLFTSASHLDANLFSTTLQTLTNGTASSLGDHLSAGPGDATAGEEWDVTLAPGSTLLLSKTLNMVVPEPGVAAILALGFASLVMARKKGLARDTKAGRNKIHAD